METHDQPTANGTPPTASTAPPTNVTAAAPTVVSATPNGIGSGIENISPYFTSERDCTRNFKRSFKQTGQCQIYNNTLETCF